MIFLSPRFSALFIQSFSVTFQTRAIGLRYLAAIFAVQSGSKF